MGFTTVITILHLLGTAIGVGGITIAEFIYIRSVKKRSWGPVVSTFFQDEIFRPALRAIWFGVCLLVISAIGYFVHYSSVGGAEVFLDGRLLAKGTILLVIIASAFLLKFDKIPMWLSNALALTSWYAALILGVWRNLEASYFVILGAYILVTALVGIGKYELEKSNKRRVP